MMMIDMDRLELDLVQPRVDAVLAMLGEKARTRIASIRGERQKRIRQVIEDDVPAPVLAGRKRKRGRQQKMPVRVDLGTPEAMAKGDYVIEPASEAGRQRRRSTPPIEYMFRRGSLNERQFLVGRNLRDSYEVGVLGAREETSDLPVGISSTTSSGYAMAQLMALEYVREAESRLGAHLWPTVEAIAIHEMTAAAYAAKVGRNQQEVVGVLKVGLSILADAIPRLLISDDGTAKCA
ncbi:hypothetical protein [Oceanibaculum indicum]|uniref:Uncharacterized protein n=1 Tax=Oceanibaculum indicum TaxID=526216 RepID=A0A420WGR9_9PROT|nr:hypothetical protein [Oceanibaculum indicum]RKQ70135.1 hypothetical protein BCL74_2075 [Oceanibaculum indicum]